MAIFIQKIFAYVIIISFIINKIIMVSVSNKIILENVDNDNFFIYLSIHKEICI